MSNDWQTVEGKSGNGDGELRPAHNFDEQKELSGIYLGRKDNLGPKNSTLFEVKLPNGEVQGFWETAVLKTKMAEVPVGHEIRIIYLGKVANKNTGNSYRDFTVQHRSPVAAPAQAQNTQAEPTKEASEGDVDDLPF